MLTNFDHFTIRTDDLSATRDFYVDVLGFVDGYRPPFDFPGNWLYLEDRPVIHVVHIDSADVDDPGSGAVDHVAFRGADADALAAHLDDRAIKYRQAEVPSLELKQFFIQDPNGITVEINCFAAD